MIQAPESLVRALLEGAVNAGYFSGAVASWACDSADATTCAVGREQVCRGARPVAPDTWFDLASLTKPLVTTTLCLRAFRSRALGPETVVGEVLTEIRHRPAGDLRVVDLLTHTAGLPAWVPLYCLAEGRPERAVGCLGSVRPEALPGSRVVYSCVGFLLLGSMLERVSDQGLDRLFHSEVLRPGGLESDLGFTPDPAGKRIVGGAQQPEAEDELIREGGFDARWMPPVEPGLPDDGNARFLGGVAGNAGLFGTVRGVLRLTREFSDCAGNLLADAERAEAVRCHTPGLEQDRGLGWQLASSPGCSAGPGLSRRAFGHTGFTGTSVWAETGGEIRVLLTNRNHPVPRGLDLHPIRRRFHAVVHTEPCRHADTRIRSEASSDG